MADNAERRRQRSVSALFFLALALLLWWAVQRWQPQLLARFAGPPQILYLSEDAAGVTQLFVVDSQGGGRRQLTETADPVTGFAPAPDGAKLAYTTSPHAAGIGGETIWLAEGNGRSPHQLLACPDAVCHHLTWAPDGRRLIFERRALDAASGVPGPPRLRWLDTVSGDTLPVLQDDAVASGASLSPDGRWIAYVAASADAVQAYDFDSGASVQVPSQVGMPPVWHPDGGHFLIADLNYTADVLATPAAVDEAAAPDDDHDHLGDRHLDLGTHLFLVDVATGERQLLSERLVVEDGAPAWSPDGAWIAFGRRQARTGAGRQLWLMRADGSAARALTDAPLVHHGPPGWSADGRFLLFQRYDPTQPQPEPGVWLLEVATGELRQLADVGFQPVWLP
ncbi:MAG: PD40 domain-containing protein [Anaerolineales bacterium]|nr:PD40 domain-containing protein [Anaerolineales bacterium]